jgi:hypothetical protein
MASNFNTRLYARGHASNVSMRAPTKTPLPPSPCCDTTCASCGLLECLCRPRFFAGQLLTEQDLNRLDAYIRAKNRMHNLQLHGWGVVNGLQVRCDDCGTGVIVGTGYAIDPCGEDIIVCADTPVDICALIKQCQQIDITCVPSSRGDGKTDCDELEADWVLAIRYSETQARSVAALRSTPSCACGATGGSCGCSGACGGGGSCGCSNKKKKNGGTSTSMSSSRTPRDQPAECEATAICEGYAWDVFLAPADPKRKDKNQLTGPLIDSIRCCLEPLVDSIPTPPDKLDTYGSNGDQWYVWCCQTKSALIGFLSSGPQSNCALIETLQSYPCPAPNDPNFEGKMDAALTALGVALIEAMFACLCNALLPPAPCGTSDDRVPLAIVTVRKSDCKVLRVCNWTHLRKLVITWPALEYWFGWIPFFSKIQDAIAAFCCADFNFVRTVPQPEGTFGMETMRMKTSAPLDNAAWKVNPTLDAQGIKDNQTMASLLMSAFARRNTMLEPAAMLNGVFGFELEAKDSLSKAEKANIAPFLLLNEVLRPMVSSLSQDAAAPKQVKPEDKEETTESLHLRVTALEKAIKDMGGKVP